MTSRGSLALLALTVVACAAHGSLTRVVVADRGTILRTISDQHTLRAFERVWHSREETDPSIRADWQYKLTIGAGDQTDIWLYDPTGYTRLLAVKNTPVYRLADYATFNALLGVPNEPPQPTRAAEPDGKQESSGSGARG